MSDPTETTILCVASFFKGNDFIRECRQQGMHVVLLTREKLLKQEWARESLDDLLAIPGKATVQSYLTAATHVARQRQITRVVALEEYDILTAAHIREHLCIAGMGSTVARRFQDKLAMRVHASDKNIPQPRFVHLLNHDSLHKFLLEVPPPWMLKPRLGASAMGIRRLHTPEDVWRAITEFDAREFFSEQSAFHLLEQFIPGDVYHVDSLVEKGKILFANVERYESSPFEVAHFGGVNISCSVQYGSPEQQRLLELNELLLSGFGMERGVTHAEFIHCKEPSRKYCPDLLDTDRRRSRAGQDFAADASKFIFLEVAARVGGAYTAETMQAARGVNPWREWARIEVATPDKPYRLPPVREEYGGIAVSLARQEIPDTSHYDDPEIVFRVCKPWHVGLVVRSPDYQRLLDLLSQYKDRFSKEFTAMMPPEETPHEHF